MITFVTKLDRNKIYEDLFNKLGEQCSFQKLCMILSVKKF